MGLLTTEVEVELTSNVKYYEKLGYEIPRRINKHGKLSIPKGTKILVKIKHLPKNSKKQIKVQCDSCGKIYDVFYATYTSCNRNGVYYCHTCALTKLNLGENHWNWNPYKTQEERNNRRNIDGYTEFVKNVSKRDNYICICCKKKCKNDLNVHHLNGYNWFVEGRIDPKNGVTLCSNCHENFHSIYGKGNNTKEQFEEWLGYALGELKKYDGVLPNARKVYCIEEDIIYNSVDDFIKNKNITNDGRVYSICNHSPINKKQLLENGIETEYQINAYTINGLHLLWYDEYLNMSQKEIENYLSMCVNRHFKKVICLQTNEVFKTITYAAEFYKCDRHGITNCCKGKRQTCGQLQDGTRLQWMYYDDYLNNTFEELKEAS